MGPELHDAIEPRPDVLSDVLSEALADAVCAASLDGVVSGAAPDAYGKPANLFAATSPSADLRSLLDEVLGRVGGLSAGQRPARSAPQSERRSRPAPGRGAGTGAQLAKLLSVLPPSTPGPVITDARRAGVALAAPGHRFEATFVGAPADYRPLRPGLDHVLGQHDATVKASVTAAFADALDRGGPEFDEIPPPRSRHRPGQVPGHPHHGACMTGPRGRSVEHSLVRHPEGMVRQ